MIRALPSVRMAESLSNVKNFGGAGPFGFRNQELC